MKLKKLFLKYCNNKKLEINNNQLNIIVSLDKFFNINFNNSFFILA